MAAPLITQTPPASELISDAGGRQRAATVKNIAKRVVRDPKALAGVLIVALFAVVAIAPRLFTGGDPNATEADKLAPPSSAHLLGTTSLGQDIYAQVIYGTRESLVVAIVAGLCATVLAVLIGVTAGYLGGVSDGVLSVVTDVFLVIPALPLVIIIAGYTKHSSELVLILVLAATGWPFGARQLRIQTMSIRGREYTLAARLRGESRTRIIFFEVLPNMRSLIVASFLNAALYSILAAAGLQFIGIGDPGATSWGTMLYFAQNNAALQTGAPLWAVVPGACIALLAGGLALLNYSFDDTGQATRPARRSRRGRR